MNWFKSEAEIEIEQLKKEVKAAQDKLKDARAAFARIGAHTSRIDQILDDFKKREQDVG